MHYFSRYVHYFTLFLLTFSIALSSCNRTPQAYFQPSNPVSYNRTTQPINSSSVINKPATDLTVSIDNVPPISDNPVWKSVDVEAEKTARVEASHSTSWQPYKRRQSRKIVPPQCDQIILRNGDLIDAKVKEVGVNEIRYKKCDRQDGPDYTISKRDVLSIKYSNGEIDRFNTANSSTGNNRQSYNGPSNQQNDGPRTDPFAIVAIAAGGLAIFTGLGSLLLGAGAVVFGALSLSRIRKEPNRFKGKGLAMAGMIIGIVAAAAILLYVYVL